VRKRLRALRGAINQLLVDEDAFGIVADNRAATRGGRLPGLPVVRTLPPTATQNTALTINVVKRVGGLYYVYSKGGKKLTRGYTTRAAAVRRLRQIEYFKQKGTNNALTTNTRWRFETDDKKLEAYQEWLQGQVDAGILEVTGPNKETPWLETYIKSAYKKGLLRAYMDTHRAAIAAAGPEFQFIEGGKAAFLDMAFNSPTAQSKMRLLGTRAFTHLKGITADMDKEMTRILTDGMARGAGARELARELNKTVTKLEKKRALAIARTETIHAHAEGQLDSFEAMGVDEVGVMAEWSTAGDDLVCDMCAPLEGVILTVKEARGMIPRHPNCRCAWLPAGVGEHIGGTTKTTWAGPGQGLAAPGTKPTGRVTGQVWHQDTVATRLRESIKAERPKLGIREAREASTWRGADLKKIKAKIKPGSKAYREAVVGKKAAVARAVEKKRAAIKRAKNN